MSTFKMVGIPEHVGTSLDPKTPLELGWFEREIAATFQRTVRIDGCYYDQGCEGQGCTRVPETCEYSIHFKGLAQRSADFETGRAIGRAIVGACMVNEQLPPEWLARATHGEGATGPAGVTGPEGNKTREVPVWIFPAFIALTIAFAALFHYGIPKRPLPPLEARAAWSTYDFGWHDLTDHMLKIAEQQRPAAPPRAVCLVIGDAIAEGVAKLLPDCDNAAAPGTTSGGVGYVTAADVTVVSLGSVDPTEPELAANLAAVRERIHGRVIWIVPTHPRPRAMVLALAKLMGDATHTFTPTRGEGFPANYPALAKAVQGSISP